MSTPTEKASHYPTVEPQPSFPKMEERILQYWARERIFEESVNSRAPSSKGGDEFVFYDGPPFANGLPHYGHLLTGYVKDVIPRYQTMRGRRVERRFGWDCHGLPAEMESEKELKISGRQQITEYGIDRFNEHCRSSVLRYTREWESYVTRQARWVDFKNDYKTMDLSYMESVIWAFKQLWQKGLLYEGFRVMPYSWACETPLSNFEIRLDNATRPRQDPAITVAFTLLERPNGKQRKILAWTTTPWTLPSNLALAVGADITYAVLEENGTEYLIAEAALPRYEKELSQATRAGTVRGSELQGARYEPLFPYFKDHPQSFRILIGEFVSTEDGTGVVHMAPGFGEDDQKVCEANGIAIVVPVDNQGRFTDDVSEFAGQHVFDANKNIIRNLKERGALIRHDTIVHNYPHCWRTDTPIIYRAMSSWYVRVTDIRERMISANRQINWIPDHIGEGQFGKWIENARDWSISRNRFWGAPIPVWRSDDPRYPRTDVYGSLDEIERDFGVRPKDLHRPYIDKLVRPNPDDPTGKSMMRRVDEVLDCWFESGSMPFAQIHYPFEHKQWFETHFPADFIVEYIAQTRGWFYTLVVLGTALFDRPPFRNCICHGVVLDENGQKLSKRLRNYPDPEEVFAKLGADALRWFLVSSPILRGLDLQIDREGKAIAEVVRTVLNPIWNSYYFFTLYANSDGIKARYRTDSSQLLDRYILTKCRRFVERIGAALDAYELANACQEVLRFLEALNNWYIRRSRDRFWKSAHDQEKIDAYDTLYTVLCTVSRALAPLLPLLSEEVYRGLTGAKSVHLQLWPDVSGFPAEDDLAAAMDQIKEACSAGLSLREANNLRTRLPLQHFTVAGVGAKALAPYSALIRDEINVKEVLFEEDFNNYASLQLQVNARELGPKLGAAMKEVLRATRDGSWELQSDGSVTAAGVRLDASMFTLQLVPKSGVAAQALPGNKLVGILDIQLTPALEEEGLARDLVRMVQQARKDAGLHVADHIELGLELGAELQPIIVKHECYLAEQTLADRIAYQGLSGDVYRKEAELGSSRVTINLQRTA